MEGSVKVAVKFRQVKSELVNQCTDCLTVTTGKPQVRIGSHVFKFDHFYGLSGEPSDQIFEDCVMPLIDASFRGYNSTVLAHGKSGSGKTYTMGTNYSGEANAGGILPRIMEKIFEEVKLRDNIEFLIRVSFIEIFNEKVFDLLDQTTGSGHNRAPIQIRETTLGGISLAGVSEPAVKSKKEMALFLARGFMNRATASTLMNSQSSRSHAVVTICIEQKRTASSSQSDAANDILISKLHLVDLASSECAKNSGADGSRLKEGIHINKGLLALGNVISALSDQKKRKNGAFVPYRDSKLTRLLQDSLGGSSNIFMIVCISHPDYTREVGIKKLQILQENNPLLNKLLKIRENELKILKNELKIRENELKIRENERKILKNELNEVRRRNIERASKEMPLKELNWNM